MVCRNGEKNRLDPNPTRSWVFVLLCLLSANVVSQTRFSALLQMNYLPPDEIVSYGDSEFQYAQYWRAKQPNSPLVIIIHGGCWLNAYKMDHVRPLASALNALGYSIWSLEYRRIGDAGGGWPGSFGDIIAGINKAGDLNRVDEGDVFLMGHSAGGHMALWAAAADGFPERSSFYNKLKVKIKGVVGLAAISNLIEYAAGSSSCEKATPRLLGGNPEVQPMRYQLASPHLLAVGVRTVLIHGERDSIVSLNQSRNFATNSALVEVVSMSNMGHFDMVNPRTDVLDAIHKALVRLGGD